jgi:transcriptional regulator with PAS, ATPase and Fis domain
MINGAVVNNVDVVKASCIIPLETIEKEHIRKALDMCRNKDMVAKALGIGRATLYRKMKLYNLGGLRESKKAIC